MILENLKWYKPHLDIFNSVFEEDNKLGVGDKFFLKKIFDRMIISDANLRMIEEDEDWAYNVSTGWVAWQTYFGLRKVNF
jgi:hypothetical protein